MNKILSVLVFTVFCGEFAMAQEITTPTEPGMNVSPPAGGTPVATTPKSSPPELGEYERLTIWRSIKWGSAYYTDPSAAQNLDVAYSFDTSDFASKGNDYELWALATEGKIALGTPGMKNTTVVAEAPRTLLWKYSITNAKEFGDGLRSGKFTVIASDGKLLGQTAKVTLVKGPTK